MTNEIVIPWPDEFKAGLRSLIERGYLFQDELDELLDRTVNAPLFNFNPEDRQTGIGFRADLTVEQALIIFYYWISKEEHNDIFIN